MQVKLDGKDVSPNIIRQTTTQPFRLIVPQESPFEWQQPIAGRYNTAMAKSYYLFFKPLPVGHHTIQLEVIRDPVQAKGYKLC
jgi:hypothetical protein